jgi:hypothetical protein
MQAFLAIAGWEYVLWVAWCESAFAGPGGVVIFIDFSSQGLRGWKKIQLTRFSDLGG